MFLEFHVVSSLIESNSGSSEELTSIYISMKSARTENESQKRHYKVMECKLKRRAKKFFQSTHSKTRSFVHAGGGWGEKNGEENIAFAVFFYIFIEEHIHAGRRKEERKEKSKKLSRDIGGIRRKLEEKFYWLNLLQHLNPTVSEIMWVVVWKNAKKNSESDVGAGNEERGKSDDKLMM